ncbi:MAG: hypothetical protein ACRER2_01430 [Methylococcales bacterium]
MTSSVRSFQCRLASMASSITNWSVAVTCASTIPGSLAACPAFGIIRSFDSGQRIAAGSGCIRHPGHRATMQEEHRNAFRLSGLFEIQRVQFIDNQMLAGKGLDGWI